MRKSSRLLRDMSFALGCGLDLPGLQRFLTFANSSARGVPCLASPAHRVCPVRWMPLATRCVSSSSSSTFEEKGSSRGSITSPGRGGALTNGARTPDEPSNRLTSIPGIGQKYEALLVSKGITTVKDLTKAFYVENDGSRDRMVGYLQEHVGIRNKNYAGKIAAHLETLGPDEESRGDEQEQQQQQRKPRVTLCVEGNISAGKSTFLKMMTRFQLQEIVEVVPEPVDKWQCIGENGVNVLDAFYRDPERYAYTFQNYVFVTRVMQEQESQLGEKPLRLLERSVFSDRMVFVRAVHEARYMTDMELNIYDSWFNPVVSYLPSLVPDGFIYLKAEPETCMERMRRRGRVEESGVSLDYLEGLHRKHEEWLNSSTPFSERPYQDLVPGREGNLILGEDRPLGSRLFLKNYSDPDFPAVPDLISDKVKVLDSKHNRLLHNCINGVPALVLDCNRSIDFQTDLEAQEELARQVQAYFQFVQALQKYNHRSRLITLRSDPMGAQLARMARDNPQAAQDYLRQHPKAGSLQFA